MSRTNENWKKMKTAPKDGSLIEIKSVRQTYPLRGIRMWDTIRGWVNPLTDDISSIDQDWIRWKNYSGSIDEYVKLHTTLFPDETDKELVERSTRESNQIDSSPFFKPETKLFNLEKWLQKTLIYWNLIQLVVIELSVILVLWYYGFIQFHIPHNS